MQPVRYNSYEASVHGLSNSYEAVVYFKQHAVMTCKHKFSLRLMQWNCSELLNWLKP